MILILITLINLVLFQEIFSMKL